MENKNLQFKTNINCGGCVATVKPHLDNADGVCHWEVDTTNKDKVLTVKSEGITEQEIIDTVKKAGFTIEPLIKK
jgi:copper chaperone|nr:heavy-metal-associated domain-containing protein [uncultured Flavobacterium sp.]